MKKKSTAILFICCLFMFVGTQSCFAISKNKEKAQQQKQRQWSVLLYYGTTAKESIAKLTRFDFHSAKENLFSIETAYAIDQNNSISKFIHPLIHQVQLATNLVERYDYAHKKQLVTETDFYLMVRRTNLLWKRFLNTTMAVGEGVSYAFDRIDVENGITGRTSPRLLNFLTFEFTVALPSHPELQLVARIHHRSGAFGLYYPFDQHPGSNVVGLGIRYYF